MNAVVNSGEKTLAHDFGYVSPSVDDPMDHHRSADHFIDNAIPFDNELPAGQTSNPSDFFRYMAPFGIFRKASAGFGKLFRESPGGFRPARILDIAVYL